MSGQPSHPSNSLIDFIPLIRSPATWTPKPVTLPPDIHPLPDDVSAYFVYPYSLENHVLNPQPPHVSHHERLRVQAEEHDRRVQFLKNRQDEKARRKREQLRKVAPGWEPPEEDAGDSILPDGSSTKRNSGILEPTRKAQASNVRLSQSNLHTSLSSEEDQSPKTAIPGEATRDVMDDLVEGLARLDEGAGR